jgi:acetyl esterase
VTTAGLHGPTAAFLADLAAVEPPSDPGFAGDTEAQRRFAERATEAVWRQHAEAGPEVAEVADLDIPLPGRTLRARTYRPLRDGRSGLPSLHLHLHGGGWWHGSVDQWIVDVQSRERAHLGDAVVVSVDYRKAPEHPFPAAVDDVVDVLAWLATRRDELRTSGRTTVSGVSAGANLAAGALLRPGVPPVDHVVLEALPAELRPAQPTFWAGPDGTGIDRAHFAEAVGWYLPEGVDAADPSASPLAAADLSAMPPTTVLIGSRDPLRAGAVAFADRLAAAGVPVRLVEVEGFVHHTAALTRTVPEARRWRSIVAAAISGAGDR